MFASFYTLGYKPHTVLQFLFDLTSKRLLFYKVISFSSVKSGHVLHHLSPHLDTFVSELFESNFDEVKIRFRFLGCRLLFIILLLSRMWFIRSLHRRTFSQPRTNGGTFVLHGLNVVTRGITLVLSVLLPSPVIGPFLDCSLYVISY